jgi:hypothetical protein
LAHRRMYVRIFVLGKRVELGLRTTCRRGGMADAPYLNPQRGAALATGSSEHRWFKMRSD